MKDITSYYRYIRVLTQFKLLASIIIGEMVIFTIIFVVKNSICSDRH